MMNIFFNPKNYLFIFLLYSSCVLSMNGPYRRTFNALMEQQEFSEAIEILVENENQPWASKKLSILRQEADYKSLPFEPKPDNIHYLLILKDKDADRLFQLAINFSENYPEEAIKLYLSAANLNHKPAQVILDELRKSPVYQKPSPGSLYYFLRRFDLPESIKEDPHDVLTNKHYNSKDPFRQFEEGSLPLMLAIVVENDADAYFAAGMNYFNQKYNFPSDAMAAALYFIEAKLRGHALADFYIARIFLLWKRDDSYIESGLNHLKSAADQGLNEAQCLYAHNLYEGVKWQNKIYLKADKEEAVKLYNLSKKTSVHSMYMLGIIYWDQFLTTHDNKTGYQAKTLMKKAADQNFASAQEICKLMEYSDLHGKLDAQKINKATQHINLSGELSGLDNIERNDSFFKSTLNDTYLFELIKRADRNELDAQMLVAKRSLAGIGTTRNLARAVKYLELAAANSAKSEPFYLLGTIFLQNSDAKKDGNEARIALSIALKRGDPRASFYLGLCSLRGIGMKQNLADDSTPFSSKLSDCSHIHLVKEALFLFADAEKILSLSDEEKVMTLDSLYERGKEEQMKNHRSRKAINLWILAGHLGHDKAAYSLFDSYRKNHIKVRDSKERSNFWLEMALRLGNEQAHKHCFPEETKAQPPQARKRRPHKIEERPRIEIYAGTTANIKALSIEYDKKSISSAELIQYANTGDLNAQFELGKIYFNTNKDESKKYLTMFLADSDGNEEDRISAIEMMSQLDKDWQYNSQTIHRQKIYHQRNHKLEHEKKNHLNPYFTLPTPEVLVENIQKPKTGEVVSEQKLIKFQISESKKFGKNIKYFDIPDEDIEDLKARVIADPESQIKLKKFNDLVYKIKFLIRKSLEGRAYYYYNETSHEIVFLLVYKKNKITKLKNKHEKFINEFLLRKTKYVL